MRHHGCSHSGISRVAVKALLLFNGGALAITIGVFGHLAGVACYINRAGSLYLFLASAVVTMLAAIAAYWSRTSEGETARHKRFCGHAASVLLLVALLGFAAGGFDFLHDFAHNQFVACVDADGGDDMQSYST